MEQTCAWCFAHKLKGGKNITPTSPQEVLRAHESEVTCPSPNIKYGRAELGFEP